MRATTTQPAAGTWGATRLPHGPFIESEERHRRACHFANSVTGYATNRTRWESAYDFAHSIEDDRTLWTLTSTHDETNWRAL